MKLKKLRLIFLIFIILFLAVFLYIKISPLGYWSCSAKLNRPNHYFLGRGCFSLPSPSERFNNEDGLKIIGDPLYFSLYSPRNFDSLKINLIFKANLSLNSPVIEAGLLVDKDLWHYQLKPVYNYYLEKEDSDWQMLNLDDDIERLLIDNCDDQPFNICLAQYNLSPEDSQFLPDLSSHYLKDRQSEKIEHEIALRGHHSFYLYLKDQSLNLDLRAKDLNQNKDKSPITIDIYTNNHLIFSQSWEDDRPEDEASAQVSESFPLSINLSSLPEGLYRVDLRANNDIVFEQLSVESSLLAWRRRLWLYSSNDENLNLFTDSRALQVKVLEPVAYQTLIFADQAVDLKELYSQVEIIDQSNSQFSYKQIFLERGGLLIEGPGVFAWQKEHLFNPDYSSLDRFYHQPAKFVLANYQAVKQLDNAYYLAELEFDLADVYQEEDKYNFIISIPGLRVEDDDDQFVEIRGIKAKFYGKTLLEKIREKLNE